MDEQYAVESARAVDAAESVVRWHELVADRSWAEIRFDAVVVPAGGSSRRHRYATQETLYVPLDGPGQIGLGEARVTVPQHGVLRVPPATPRRIVNTGAESRTWLAIGAPPRAARTRSPPGPTRTRTRSSRSSTSVTGPSRVRERTIPCRRSDSPARSTPRS
ncbi:hypothetical protein VB773_18575 [Haloarculaceae archaeon H-GB2-1]|nr:hypothetical protein [Haloarculaceae archaeon H-GB11]MEA5409375.1 hypothetical protein [Haloarculaceae archaeon H-GB2-1]